MENFDNIARNTRISAPDHNNHYYPLLEHRFPYNRRIAVDVGCGIGEFTIRLANNFSNVIGIDLSSEMIRIAEREFFRKKIRYLQQDFMTMDFQNESIDLFTSVATFHHLPYADALDKMKSGLQPNGKIILLDLYRQSTLIDYLFNIIASISNKLNRPKKYNNFPPNPKLCKAWMDHEEFDDYMTIKEIISIARRLLPGVRIRRRLLWRYTLEWEK